MPAASHWATIAAAAAAGRSCAGTTMPARSQRGGIALTGASITVTPSDAQAATAASTSSARSGNGSTIVVRATVSTATCASVEGSARSKSPRAMTPSPSSISPQRAPGTSSIPSNRSRPPERGCASTSTLPAPARALTAAARVDTPAPPAAPTTAMTAPAAAGSGSPRSESAPRARSKSAAWAGSTNAPGGAAPGDAVMTKVVGVGVGGPKEPSISEANAFGCMRASCTSSLTSTTGLPQAAAMCRASGCNNGSSTATRIGAGRGFVSCVCVMHLACTNET